LKDGKLTVVEEEAERVRMIFRRYLEVSGTNELVRDLRAKNICTKARTYSTTGKTRGALSYFLRNRFFIGEVRYRDEVLLRSSTRACSRRFSKSCQRTNPTRP
jgi:site-specific DNA recombinase